MTKEPTLISAMTPFPYSVAPDDTLHTARQLMKQHQVRHLPVTRNHEPCGLISDKEIRLLLTSSGQMPASTPVAEAMNHDCYTVDTSAPLRQVLKEMVSQSLDAVIVTTHGRLAGIFTTVDACRSYAALLDNLYHAHEDDPDLIA